MNLLLIRFGYPIAILTKDDRLRYYEALEESQGGGNLTPFIRLVIGSVLEGIEFYEDNAQPEQMLVNEQDTQFRDNYDVFASAMRLLQVTFKQTAQNMNPNTVSFRDFGILGFESYQALRLSPSDKWTWFFRLVFSDSNQYLFFFDHVSSSFENLVGNETVTLHIAKEVNSYQYERLSQLSGIKVPDILEISYIPKEERFVYANRKGDMIRMKAEEIASEFIKQAFQHFS